jgi:hypothetical protein
MELEDLKKTVNTYIDGIEKRLSLIESNSKKLKSWSNLRKSVTENVQQTDEAVLKQMTSYFGEGCLKALLREVAHKYIKDFEEKITAQSCDLKMIVKPKSDAQ